MTEGKCSLSEIKLNGRMVRTALGGMAKHLDSSLASTGIGEPTKSQIR